MERLTTEERTNRHRAIVLTALVLVAVVAAWAAFAGVAAAATDTSVYPDNPGPGVATNHTWSMTADADGTLTSVEVNYSGTGTNLSAVDAADVSVMVEEGDTFPAYTAENVTVRESGEVAVIELPSDDRPNVSSGGAVLVDITGHSVVNPQETGTYNASIDLRNGSTTFDGGTATLEITPTGTVSGQITNATDDTPIDGAFVHLRDEDGVAVVSTATAADGSYELEYGEGNYEVVATGDGYNWNSTTVTLADGDPKTADISLKPTETVSGQITNASDGTPIADATVRVKDDGETVIRTTTDGDGAYRLPTPVGNYQLVASADGYADNSTPINLTAGDPVTANLTLSPVATGTVSGQVTNASDGTPIAGVGVGLVKNGSYVTSTETASDGTFQLEAPEGDYELTVWADGYDDNWTEVSLTDSDPKTVDLTLKPIKTFTGQITDASDGAAIADASVELRATAAYLEKTTTDSDGRFQFEVPVGSYELSAWADGYADDSTTVNLTADGPGTVNLSLSPEPSSGPQWPIVNTSVEHVGGTAPESMPTVNTYETNLLGVQLFTPNGSQELSGIGVANDTEFRVTVEAKNVSPRVLIGTARDLNWTTEAVGENTTRITMTGTPASAQYNTSHSDLQDWPENDTADFAYEQTWDVAIDEMNHTHVTEAEREEVDGMVLGTDAQSFTPPSYDSASEEVRVTVGGPHYTVDGEVNDGFFEAFLPRSLLDAWNVSGPSDLNGSYKGEQSEIAVTDVDGGYRVEMNVSYSAGDVAVTGDDVAEPANLDVTVDGTTAPVTEGETVEVTATVENTGDEPAEQTVALGVDGEAVDAANVSLAGGESTQVTFDWTTADGDAGDYTAVVSSDDASASTGVTVESAESGPSPAPSLEPADFHVTIDDAPSSVELGETLAVEVTVRNRGDKQGEQEITLTVGDRTVDSAELTIRAGGFEQTTLTFETADEDRGDVTATVASDDDSESTTVAVETDAPASEEDGEGDGGDDETEASEDESDARDDGAGAANESEPSADGNADPADDASEAAGDDETPGFGAGAAALGAVLGLAIRARRRDV